MSSQFARFLASGGIAAVVNWGSRIFLSQYMPLTGAIVVAYLAGMTTAYLLMKFFVFSKSRLAARQEYLRFCLVNVLALIQTWAVTMALVRYAFPLMAWHWHPEATAHAIGVLTPVLTSYLGHRNFSFPPLPEQGRVPDTQDYQQLPLVVDLDGTLVRTDTLLENFAASLFSKPFRTIQALAFLFRGRAAFKRRLADTASFDVETLPYRQDLVAYLAAQKTSGRQIHLASAADETIARRIGGHLGLFDTIHGSNPPANLKGREKARHLQALFPGGFVYAGDSAADLDIWNRSAAIILVGPSARTLQAARNLGRPVEKQFDRPALDWRVWRKGLRIHHWSKNILIFVAILLSHNRTDVSAWLACACGFVLMGIAASATYLCNDLADLDADRRHRSKRLRALASGALPIHLALIAITLMIGLALGAATLLLPAFGIALAAYIATTLSYSLWLKRIALLDIVVLAWLYTLRIIMGTLLAGVIFSPWLLTFAAFFFLSMSLAKRHVELVAAVDAGQDLVPGRGYRASDAPLTLVLGVSASVASVLIIVEYLMAEAFPSGLYHAPGFLSAAPVILMLWIMRIWLLAHRGALYDDPVSFALRDRASLVLAACLAAAFALAAAA